MSSEKAESVPSFLASVDIKEVASSAFNRRVKRDLSVRLFPFFSLVAGPLADFRPFARGFARLEIIRTIRPGDSEMISPRLLSVSGKKKFSADPSCCPVCGVTVRPQELEQHFAQELDRLCKVSAAPSRPRSSRSALLSSHPQDHSHGAMLHAPSAADGTPQGRWETYKRIKANRQVSHRRFFANFLDR